MILKPFLGGRGGLRVRVRLKYRPSYDLQQIAFYLLIGAFDVIIVS